MPCRIAPVHRVLLAAVFVLGATLPTACSSGDSESKSITFYAAASTTDACEEVISAFETQVGIGVSVNFASSGKLAQQIDLGGPADVFLSANEQWADHVERGTADSKRVDLLQNSLVLIAPKEDQTLGSSADLLKPTIELVAIGEPDSVPAGIYAKQVLVRRGLWEKLQGKLLFNNTVRQTLVLVERAEADAGVVYATDATVSDRVRIVEELDRSLHEPVVYPVLLLKLTNSAASQFFNFLQSSEAREIFERHGFIVSNQ